ncbi:hypothetical protein BV22DRAFT_1135328 [Leucogyrophana mollusca]|uniref:Uncharacterized protein n=1 Tax=Leucogyrophana mollusca TaxID=85980 RepID=A0ACB8AWC4_9AGAM|nr:hypothetical protein BV22DRAFT_1135328 [Leucogyrophana mollusca]
MPPQALSFNISNFPSFSIIVKDRWIVDQSKNQTLGKILSYISLTTSASYGTLLAIGCHDGKVIVVDFPPLLYASPDTIGVITMESENEDKDKDKVLTSEEENCVF